MSMSKDEFEKHCHEFDVLAEKIAFGLAEYAEQYGSPKPAPEFRTKVFEAAERANKRFGQWMPRPWLDIFISEMLIGHPQHQIGESSK